MSHTVVGPLLVESHHILAGGKMLRSRLVGRLGAARGRDARFLVDAGAAIELIHAASLLHDDVIDGGRLRRGMPAFWAERGIPGAILLGDLMLIQALRLLAASGSNDLLNEAIQLTGEVCEAEAGQELMRRGVPATWNECLEAARRKTGSLFALAAVAGAGEEDALRAALRESGYLIGTAYQLADDFLDARGDSEAAGKTLGLDEEQNKFTAFRVALEAAVDIPCYLETLLARSLEGLASWPPVREAWRQYLEEDLHPVLDRHLCLPGAH